MYIKLKKRRLQFADVLQPKIKTYYTTTTDDKLDNSLVIFFNVD